jgi:hypothetical protein
VDVKVQPPVDLPLPFTVSTGLCCIFDTELV